MNKALTLTLFFSFVSHTVFIAVLPVSRHSIQTGLNNGIVSVSVVAKQAAKNENPAIETKLSSADGLTEEPMAAKPARYKKEGAKKVDFAAPSVLIEDASESGGVAETSSDSGGEFKASVNGIIPPQELYFPEPKYPALAKKQKLQGSVRLSITVDCNGNVTSIDIDKSSGHKALDAAALSVKNRLRYLPAHINGSPVNFTLTKTVTFVLENR